MKVVISHKPLHSGSKTRGVGVYTHELINAFHKYFPETRLIASSKDYYHEDADLVHFPFFDPFFLSLPSHFKKPTIITIHDLTPLKFPTHFPSGLKGKIKLWMQTIRARRANKIITDSECSKRDIVEMLGIVADQIVVIPLAHTKEKVPTVMARKIAGKYKLPDRYILYVGDINWNKNIVGLIKSFSALEDDNIHLVLVGKVFGDMPKIPEWKDIDQAIENSNKKDMIHLLGYVPSHHLPVLYANATLYVQPSWYEGFGLPLLEAMTYGCPVASSNRGSLPEVGGDAVVYFDPDKDMTQVIADILSNTRKRNSLVQKGLERVKLFSWEKTASETKQVYEQVVGK
ncbi:MAG: glycosyltransferase family 1 protein [bacterium]